MANSFEWRIETEAAVRGLGTVSQILLWFTRYAAFLTLVLELNCPFMRPTALRLEGILVLILGRLPRSTGETATQTLVVGLGRQALAGQAEWSGAHLLTPGPLIWLLPPSFVTVTKACLTMAVAVGVEAAEVSFCFWGTRASPLQPGVAGAHWEVF